MRNEQTAWSHHRSGWKYVLNCLRELHNPRGPQFVGWADGYFSLEKNPIRNEWVGFFHGVPQHPIASKKYQIIKGLDDIFTSELWHQSKGHCHGIFTLCEHIAQYIHQKTGILTSSVIHPSEEPEKYFTIESFETNKNPKIIMIGHWLRKYEAIYSIQTNLKRCILLSGHGGLENDLNYLRKVTGDQYNDIYFMNHLSSLEYDNLLASNIIFLNLYDVAANNTIIDCIIRNTPILVNRLPAAEEYLGIDYPLFYSNLQEASNKLSNKSLIQDATNYLATLVTKKQMTKESFLTAIKKSTVYKNLKPIRSKLV